jgi:hypothetical protein
MRKVLFSRPVGNLILAVVALLALPLAASATTYVYNSWSSTFNFSFTKGFPTTNPNEFELDHYYMYSWKLRNVDLDGAITAASITFHEIRNWDSSANQLFMHLLDTARFDGVSRFRDASTSDDPPVTIRDNWDPAFYPSGLVGTSGSALITPGTGNTTLSAAPSFGTSPVDYTYNFTASEILKLAEYIGATSAHTVALGFDPNCHYWNDGITFTITTSGGTSTPPIPEPGTMLLFATGAAGIARMLRRRRSA